MRYFFITNRVTKKDISVEWCPTGDMKGDYFTNPVQGALFRKLRDLIMGVSVQQQPGPGNSKSKVKDKKLLKKNKRD